LFPRVPDQHKVGKPLIPYGLGVIYVLFSIFYLFSLELFGYASVNGIPLALTLAVCILFGGFMGVLDDWMDLKWRYKAFLPLIASLPLVYLTSSNPGLYRTEISLPFLGVVIDFGMAYFYVIIPLIIMVVTNTVNQLGGLNGLETVCPAIVLVGLLATSELLNQPYFILMLGPLLFWLALSALNFQGKIFIGNSGSFAIGITIAAFAVITDLKLCMAVSILPFVVNSILILFTIFLFKKKAHVSFDGKKLFSDHRRSLVTLITHKRSLTERQVVVIISLLVAISTTVGVLVEIF
jgi:UDP-N-acetylglucosamine--dolichyl-phosphate N-acetylglucosaminephosphotransferase